MKRHILGTYIFIMSFLFSAMALADKPEEMLKATTEQLLSVMHQNNAHLKQDPNYIVKLVDEILVPHVDTAGMAQWVVGRSAWTAASHEDQEAFTKEFKYLVIKTYASTLNAYNNQKIEYLPIRGDIGGKTRVQVQSIIKEPGKEVIRVAYRLVKSGNSWRVYDIIIEGVSILKGFQSQFAPDIRTGGVKKAIEVIRAHNQKPMQRAGKKSSHADSNE